MQITLPHAGDKAINVCDLVAAWIHYCERIFESSEWREFIMPINHVKEGITKHPGFDALCRILAGGGYVGIMQATNSLFARNTQCVEKLSKAIRNASADRAVHSVRLTATSIREWDSMEEGERGKCLDHAERMLLADHEDESRDEAISGDMGEVAPHTTTLHASAAPPRSEVNSLDKLTQCLVDVVDLTPFQAHYWRRPWGVRLDPPQGWKHRHDSYFWPSPRCGGEHNHRQIADFVSRFRPLVERIAPNLATREPELNAWSAKDQELAVDLAKDIFTWGGVGRDDPEPVQVFEVVRNAVAGQLIFRKALMNSGWTKVAAFASEAAQDIVEPQAIWDSRVSTAVIKNLDLIVSPTARVFADLPLRLVPGRGGTRPDTQNTLRSRGWAYGWRGNNDWRAHFTGAKIVTQIRHVLNANPRKFGIPAGSDRWSNRAVEMALFMEGY
jgi:hypothetical protein